MEGLPHTQIKVELEPRLLGVAFVWERDFEHVSLDLNDDALASFQKIAQALRKLGVVEPQSDPHVSSLRPGGPRAPLSPWNRTSGLSMLGRRLPRSRARQQLEEAHAVLPALALLAGERTRNAAFALAQLLSRRG
jgi:hypothetical protein